MDYQQYFQDLMNQYHCELDIHLDLSKERMKEPVKFLQNHLVLDDTRSFDYTKVINEFLIYHMMKHMEITTEHLTIHELSITDLHQYLELVSDEEVCYFEASTPLKDQSSALRRLMDVKLSAKGIYLEGSLIGVISYIKDSARVTNGYEIGYSIASKYQNRGLGTEALKGFCNYVLQNTPIDILTARVLVDNPRSSYVLEKVGFIEEGIRKQSLLHPMLNQIVSTIVYSIEKN